MTDESSGAVRDRAIADARIAEQQVAELRQVMADLLPWAADPLTLHPGDQVVIRARALLTRTAP